MGVHWGLPLMESLLSDDMRENLAGATYVDPSLDGAATSNSTIRVYDGPTGKIMKDVPVKGRLVRVSRRRLRAFLARGIDVEVR